MVGYYITMIWLRVHYCHEKIAGYTTILLVHHKIIVKYLVK